MIHLLIGVVAAIMFAIGSSSVYGYQALLENAWTGYVLGWLIGTGIVLASLDSTLGLRCKFCRHLRRIPLCTFVTCR